MTLYPQDLAERFPRSALLGQFILAKSESLIPHGWEHVCSPPWHLGFDPRLPLQSFKIKPAGLHGWLLGHAVDPEFKCLGFSEAALFKAAQYKAFEGFESLLNRLSGKFAAIVFSPSGNRLYSDASGQLSVVYCADRQALAASPLVLPYWPNTEDDRELVERMDIPQSNGLYPFGLTPRRSIKRLLPNHYLDLDTWNPRRFWPSHDILQERSPSDIVNEIAYTLRRTIEAICTCYTPYMSLTSGRDSRMLLAVARGMTDDIQFFTWEIPDEVGKTDLSTGRRLAKRHHLRHQVFPFEEPTQQEKGEWLYRTGLAVGELRGLSLVRALRMMDSKQPYVPGLAGEVGRAFYWCKEDLENKTLAASTLLRRLKTPSTPRLLDAAQRWLADVPIEGVCNILDLAYIEQRLGCWAGANAYGNIEGPFRLPPFSNRRVFALAMSLPHEFRYGQLLADTLIKQQWPELLRVPFSSTDWRKRTRLTLLKTPFFWRLGRWF